MRVEKENLIIRSANVNDAQILTDWWNDGELMAHAGFPKGLNQTIEATIKQIKQNETKLSQTCIIEIDQKPVGEMSFGIGKNFAEIGIKICEVRYQNKGYGSKLIQMLIHFLFFDDSINNVVKIDKIILDTNLKNIRAQHVYEKLGFKKLATNRDAWQDQLGEWQSSVDYAVTVEDYCKLNRL